MNDPIIITRAEFDMLREQVTANAGLIGQSATLATQLTEVIKDVSEVRSDLREFRRDHEQQHKDEAVARTAGRRWLIATAIALLVAIEGPLAYLIVHVR